MTRTFYRPDEILNQIFHSSVTTLEPDHDLSTGNYTSDAIGRSIPVNSIIQIVNDGNIDTDDVTIKISDSLDGTNFSEVSELETVIDKSLTVTTIRATDWYSKYMKIEIDAGTASAGVITKINYTK